MGRERMTRNGERKRARRTSVQQEDDEKSDRLSDLPDAIIHQIMSFLDIKDAIQTCVLSKRWKHLWVSLADLNFDDEGFTKSEFRKFVRKVLCNHADCNICKFQLYSYGNPRRSLMNRVLNYVASHNVQHVEIDLAIDGPLYSCLSLDPFLNCNTLKTLELNGFGFDDLSESFSFGFTMLTSMDLYECEFNYVSGSADPFASCPNLKKLRLSYCRFSSLQVLKISGLQLLNLEIEVLKDVYFSFDCKVEIFAPKLTSFYFGGSAFIDFSSLDIPSLCYANICPYICYWTWSLDQKEKYSLDLINLFRGLYNAEVLRLPFEIIKFLDWVPSLEEQQPTPFRRLKSLLVECVGISFEIPDRVKNYLLGDNPYEKTMFEKGLSPRTRYLEFRKVQV